jgi:hypothetical protein
LSRSIDSIRSDIRTLKTAPGLKQCAFDGAGHEQFRAQETEMKKILTLVFALSLLTALSLVAQDTAQQDTKAPTTSTTSAKSAHIMGKISDDGKSFVSDKDGKSWTISNPDAVKGHEGHHVVLKANVDTAGNQVEVVSLKMAGDKMKKDSSTPN